MLARIKKDLPNFPDEVISDWLLTYANQEGWPPSLDAFGIPIGRWKALLVNQSFSYWQSVHWERVNKHISAQELNPDSQNRVVNLFCAAVMGKTNLWSLCISDLKPRFDRIVQYISEHGEFPCPPLLVKGPLGYNIVDGNHRMAAFLYCYGYFRVDPDAELQLKTKHTQTFWLGEPNHQMSQTPPLRGGSSYPER